MGEISPGSLILGVSFSHDSGAALVRDGRLIAAANEERFDRNKGSSAIPLRSVAAVLKFAGCKESDIDSVAVAGLIQRGPGPTLNTFRKRTGRNREVVFVEWLDRIRLARLLLGTETGTRITLRMRRLLPKIGVGELLNACYDGGMRANVPVEFIDHHMCHLASAYFTSGFEDCLAISNDGFGDGLCFRAALYDRGEARQLASLPLFHSIGNYYSYATEICGFPMYYHCGKTTGLAAFGNAEKTGPIFCNELQLHPKTGLYNNRGSLLMNEIQKLRRLLRDVPREDIAAGVQEMVEKRCSAVVRQFLDKTGQRRLALAGGVHANVKLNQRLVELDGVEAVFVHPHMGDGGLPAGAAFSVWASNRPKRQSPGSRLRDAYLGPDLDPAYARAAVQAAGLKAEQLADAEMQQRVAELLAAGNLVAVARGRLEYGPRALCNRSIL